MFSQQIFRLTFYKWIAIEQNRSSKQERTERGPKQVETCDKSLADKTPGGQGHKENFDIKCAIFEKCA